jgi:hypothetical protein
MTKKKFCKIENFSDSISFFPDLRGLKPETVFFLHNFSSSIYFFKLPTLGAAAFVSLTLVLPAFDLKHFLK